MGLEGPARMLVAAGIAAGATLAIDQGTKAITRATMEPGDRRDLALGGQVGLMHVRNFGSAYGLIGQLPVAVPAIATAVLGGGALLLGRGSAHATAAGIGAGLLIGGGVSNVIDRLHQGHVTDMLHTTDLFGYYNVADVAVLAGLATGGVAILRSL